MKRKSTNQVLIPFIVIFLAGFLSLTFIPDTVELKTLIVVAIVTFAAIISQSVLKTVDKVKEQNDTQGKK
jgi:hypothetical protein